MCTKPNHKTIDWLIEQSVELGNAAKTLKEEVRSLCSECKTSKQNGNLHGYTCPKHFKMFNGYEMPTLGEV